MQGFSAKLTAYDFLGMLIPGIVVTYCIYSVLCYSDLYEMSVRFYCGCKCEIEKSPTILNELCKMVIFISFSYIIGIVVNIVSDVLFGRFRNNELHILIAALLFRKRQYGDTKNLTDCKKRSVKGIINRVWRCIRQVIGCRTRIYTSVERKYYSIYYWLLHNNKMSGAVAVLESQVVFARNMVLPTIFMAIYFFVSSSCMTGGVFILLCILELIIMYLRQMRVYYIVFEDYNWHKQMDDYDKNNNNITDYFCRRVIRPGSKL